MLVLIRMKPMELLSDYDYPDRTSLRYRFVCYVATITVRDLYLFLLVVIVHDVCVCVCAASTSDTEKHNDNNFLCQYDNA